MTTMETSLQQKQEPAVQSGLVSHATTKMIFRGGSRGSVGAVCPAAPMQGSLQIMYLQGRFPGRPYKSISRGGCCFQPPLQIYLQGQLILQPPLQIDLQGRSGNTSRPYKSICRGGYSTNRPYKSFFHKKKLNLQFKFDLENHLKHPCQELVLVFESQLISFESQLVSIDGTQQCKYNLDTIVASFGKSIILASLNHLSTLTSSNPLTSHSHTHQYDHDQDRKCYRQLIQYVPSKTK